MRRFDERIIKLSDFISEYEKVPDHSSDWRDSQIKKIKKLADGIALDSVVRVCWIKGRVRNTLDSITKLQN